MIRLCQNSQSALEPAGHVTDTGLPQMMMTRLLLLPPPLPPASLQRVPRDQDGRRSAGVQEGVRRGPEGVQAAVRRDGRHQRPVKQTQSAAGHAGRHRRQIPGEAQAELTTPQAFLRNFWSQILIDDGRKSQTRAGI